MGKFVGKQIKYGGVVYPSLVEIAKAYDCPYGNLKNRLWRGWPIGEALGLKTHVKAIPKNSKNNYYNLELAKLEFAKRGFRLLATAYVSQNHPMPVICSCGTQVTMKLGTVMFYNQKYCKYCKGTSITVDGVKYRTISEVAREYNIATNRVAARIRNGWTIEEALNISPRVYDTDLHHLVEGQVYRIRNIINNKCYVGITSKKARERWSEHKRNARLGHIGKFYDAIRKDGIKNFKFKVLATTLVVNLPNLERKYIKKYNTMYPYGYNSISGGGIGGINFGIPIMYEGKQYSSLFALCRHKEVSYSRVYARLNSYGKTLEQALALVEV